MVVLQLLGSSSRCFSAVEGNSTNTCIHDFSFLLAESPRTSIKKRQTLTTHNTDRHCRVRFYTFARQSLSKQLYPTEYRIFSGRGEPFHFISNQNFLSKCLLNRLIRRETGAIKLSGMKNGLIMQITDSK